MEQLFLFVLVILVITILVNVLGIKRHLRRTTTELDLLSQRLDFLRKELDKAGIRRSEPPILRTPAPDLPGTAQVSVPSPETGKVDWAASSASFPFVTAPPPLPTDREGWKLEPDRPGEKEGRKFGESAREILRKMRNWILYGAEEKPQDVTTEYILASTWLPRLAVVFLVLFAKYLVTWSIQHGFLDAQARVTIIVMAGAAMLISGKLLLGKKYHVIAQGLLGGGLLVMYLGAYAAGPLYHLFGEYSTPVTFALMILVTVAAGVLAVSSDSMLIAIIGIAGGYFTPVMLRTDIPNLPGLYSYILLLCLGIIGIAHKKQWRLLNYIGFVLTYALVLGSIRSGAYQRADFPVAMAFLTSYFAVYSFLVYFYNMVKGYKSTMLEIMLLVANGAVFAYIGYDLIYGAYGRPYPAVMSLLLAFFYIAHVFAFLRKKKMDRQLLMALIALAGFFTAWTLPLALEKETLTIALALMAFMFFWLGLKLQSNFLQNLGYALYMILFYRLLFIDVGRDFSMKPPVGLLPSVYWHEMLYRLFTFGVSIGSIAGAFFLQLKRPAAFDALTVGSENDMPDIIVESVAQNVFYWFGALFAFLVLNLEFNVMFQVCYPPIRLPVLTVLWCGMVIYFLWKYLRGEGPEKVMVPAMCVFIAGALVKLLAVDLSSWQICGRFIYDMDYNVLYAGMRLLDFGAILATLIVVWRMARGRGNVPAAAFGYAALIVLFLYTTLELNSLLFWKLRDFQAGGISVLWALFAITFIAAGIWKKILPLRYVGLFLVVFVVAKVFVVDLEKMPGIYKALALVVVGVFFLVGSFVYIRSSKSFFRSAPEVENDKEPEDEEHPEDDQE
jgi:hypothetical protein